MCKTGTTWASKHGSRLFSITAILAATVVPGATRLEAKSTNDVVVMKNGDKFTGEIKKLENGVLFFKSAYMVDSVQLDWAGVERLESGDHFNVLFASGQHVTGGILAEQGSQETSGYFAVQSGGAEIRAAKSEVVRMIPVEDTFLEQLVGSIDYGFSFTGGTNTMQSSLSGDVEYRSEGWAEKVSGSSVLNRESGARKSGRNTLDTLYARYLSPHWYAGATATLLSSNQQDLTLRASGGGGIGRDFVRTGTASLSALGAVVFSREQYSVNGEQPQKNQAEALFGVFFSKYAFRTLEFTGQAVVYPNLTTLGRVRLSQNSSLQFQIVRNLYWKLSVYENYDSRPPVSAPKNDFGTSTSIGWKF
jgi:putative salt-induced outer membrane protein YdiY